MEGLILLLSLLSLLPQTTVTGEFTRTGEFTVVATEPSEQLQVSDCCEVCQEEWTIAGVFEPFELACTNELVQVGSACRCWDPGPKKRLDGSQNP